MAEKRIDVESLLSRARDLEKEYDWPGAADYYGSELEALPKDDLLGIGRAQEAAAHALFRAAMQGEDIEEFKDRLSKSEKQYEKAKQSYEKASSPLSSPRISRCEAMIAYLGFWQTSDVATKKKKIGEAWSLAKKAMETFGRDEVLELGKTYDELFLSSVLTLHFSDDQQIRKTILSEAITYGEKAVTLLSNTENTDELVRALVYTAGFLSAAGRMSVVSVDEQDRNNQKALEYWRKALGLSEETASVAKPHAEIAYELLDLADFKELRQIAERQLDYVRKTGDRLSIGVTLGVLAFGSYWPCGGMEDPEEVNALLEKSLRYVEEARRQFGKIGFVTPDYFSNVWVSSPSQPWYSDMQAIFETDLKRKRELASESLESARLESVAAEKSGYPYVVAGSHYTMGVALASLAKMEVNKENKTRLLEEAIQHRMEASRLEDVLMPSQFWNRAIYRCLIGETELELAEVTDCSESRKASIESSISHMREGLDLFLLQLTVPSYAALLDATNFWRLSSQWRNYGRALQSGYGLTGAQETIVSYATAFEKAAEFGAKGDQPSRVAESLWEAARAYDTLGEHLKASERFEEASEQYRKAAEKIKSLGQLYKDQSLYLKAWSEIEKARYHHARQDPASAKEHYNKAAELHESTDKWSLLSTNYFAWAQVENAEDLSQRERCKESIDAFGEAARLFKDSESKMREQQMRIEGNDERQMIERLIDAADSRQELCKARIALEEARLLDKEGRFGNASERYGLVADLFAKIKQGLAAEQDRQEIELIITLSKAWKAMAKAEAESSPELFEEAAHFFDEAKNLSSGDKAKNLALGHSRFCRALQAGVKFSDTGDLAQHDIATDNLESAGKYYLKAGIESASEYARASSLLFDAYVHMSKARKEQDQEKKAKLYILAERILQASASSYDKADQPGKKDQVLKLQAKVGQDRELAISLSEIFRAPDVVSTTMAFSSPAPTQETAVGLDRFEHAEVQATLIVKPNELHVGQELSLEIELVNAGRGAAQLTRVDKAVPKGFDVVTAPEKYRIEDSYLNLRGRRLDAPKTEDVRLVLKPTVKGHFKLKPRVMYLDDSGTYRSCELAPVEVLVKEMGISGWLRGT